MATSTSSPNFSDKMNEYYKKTIEYSKLPTKELLGKIQSNTGGLQTFFINAFPYITMILFIIYFVSALSYMASDNRSKFSRANIYILLILVPFILVLYAYYTNPASNMGSQVFNSTTIGLFSVIGLTLFIAMIVYYVSTLKSLTSLYLLYGLIMVLIGIVIIGLAIFANVFMNQIKQITGMPGFIIHLILYIPCLVSDYFKYILGEFNATPLVVYVLFLIEIILLLIYFYAPILWKKALGYNGVIVIQDPQFLYRKIIVANSDVSLIPDSINPSLKSDDSSAGVGNDFKRALPKIHLKQFALSLWIQVNATNIPTEKQLFDYAEGSPSIIYLGQSELWKFRFSNNENNIPFYTKVPFQKWNFIVFNYRGNYVDLFINGNLEKTYPFQENEYPEYLNTHTMTTGDTNGVDGAICNVSFYPKPLEINQIVQNYNYLILQNPPVNNLL